MNREVVDKWCERGILGLALAILVLMPLVFGGRPQPATGVLLDFLILDPFVLAEWLMVPLLALWVVRIWTAEPFRFLWPPICWAVTAFTLYAIARYWNADIEYVARQELLRVLVYALFFFAVVNNLHRQETTQIIAFTLIFLAMTISLYALYQFFTDSNRVWHVLKPYDHRASGTYISPNHLGGFLEMILPLGLAYTILGRAKPLTKILLGYASLVIVAALCTTLSRGAWAATLVALLAFFGLLMFRKAYRLPAVLVLVGIILSAVYFVPRSHTFQVRLKQLTGQQEVDDDMRFALWGPALKIWRENVWWGVGPAHFDHRFRQHRPETVQLRPDRVHNDYLNTLVDWGVAGTALIALAWALLAFGVWKTWRFVRKMPADIGAKKGSGKFAFVLGAAIGLVAILVHSVVDFNLHIPANALVVVVLMALLSSHLRFATERYWVTARAWSQALASVILLGGAAYLALQGWSRTAENVWLARAARVPLYSPAQFACYESAFRAEPRNPETAVKLGEILRTRSLHGGTDYQKTAEQAMEWFQRGMKLNPWSAKGYLGYGWCLDWLGRLQESPPYFAKAEEVDGNSYFTAANIGLHYTECGDFAAAKPWFERSLRLNPDDNTVARRYLVILEQKLIEAAAGAAKPGSSSY